MGDGFADRYSGRCFLSGGLIDATPDRGFRWAIFVVQGGVRQELVMSSHKLKGKTLPGCDDDTKRFQLPIQCVTEDRMVQRRDPHHV